MPLFEFDAGQLIPAQVGHAVTEPVDPAVLDAVRAQVLELLRLPLLPVTWQDHDGAPRLTAMDPAGHVVSVEVLERLDAPALVAALARASRSGAQGWIDVARSYPSGVGAFRRDWNAFREAQPVGTVVSGKVHVVAAQIEDDARQALDALAGAGVVVHELSLRAMTSGRLFLDVTEVSAPVAPLPWLLPGRPAVALEQPAGPVRLSAGGPPEPALETQPGPDHPPARASAERPADDTTPVAVATEAAPQDEDLLSICASLTGPVPLVWEQDGRRREAMLLPEGVIVVGERPFTAPEAAARAAAGGQVAADPWSAWRFGAEGPSLREAREELRQHRSRSRARRVSPGRRVRRRDLRRRPAND